MTEKPRYRVLAGSSVHTGDSFQNVAARLGYGTGNMAEYGAYAYRPLTRNRPLLDRMYRGSWLVGAAVDAPADDMTKAGIELVAQIPPDQAKLVMTQISRLGVWSALADVARWARLYGGAIGVIRIAGQDMSTPLVMDTIGRGMFQGMVVLDRWMVEPSLLNLVEEGPAAGQPKFYRVVSGTNVLDGELIHCSRVVRMEGVQLPYYERQSEMGWGMSVLERVYDRLLAFDSTTQGAAQLVYKAHLRMMKVKGLRNMLVAGGKAVEGFYKNMEMIRGMQSNEGLTVIDSEDEFETTSYSFAGLSDIMVQFAQQLSGAVGVPMVRLFGQTPTGLNTNGESDLRTYYDNIGRDQNNMLHDPVTRLVSVSYRSTIGKAPELDLDFAFRPLWQMTAEAKAGYATSVTTAVSQAMEGGIIDRPTAMKELKESSETTGIYSNITDRDIEEARAFQNPPTIEQLALGGAGLLGLGGEGPAAGGQPPTPAAEPSDPREAV